MLEYGKCQASGCLFIFLMLSAIIFITSHPAKKIFHEGEGFKK